MSWRGDLPAVCWNAAEAEAIIPVEAESTSDGVFMATHSTIPILQRDQVQRLTGGKAVTEQALLQAVREQPADQPIIPILGKSGAGKSHLVRWLRINLEQNSSTRMIFVPKHKMSLRSILKLILEHAEGARVEELRDKVDAAVDAASDETVARLRLASELAILLQTRGATKGDSPERDELRAYLAAPDGLPALFGDVVFKRRLLSDGGPIARLVKEKLDGKGALDKDEAFGFVGDDLNLSVDDIKSAGGSAQQVASILTSDSALRELAASMLNEQLGPAVSEVFGIGGDDLKQILIDVRVDLAEQGLELLLLIEDFSIFQGIQGGLIDAITLISTEELTLCPMRVVMAVTSGYFTDQMPDTVFTRTFKVFDLELPQDSTVVFDPTNFAARYLNAVRTGTPALNQLHENHESVTSACEQCPVNQACHAAFGQVDGFGLFPFNPQALGRAIESQSKDGAFVARDVLTRVVRPVLHRDGTEIESDRFPSAAFAEDFKSGAIGLLDDIEALQRLRTPGDKELSDRRERLVRFWGSGDGPENLNPTIHSAFGVPPIDGLDAAPDPSPIIVRPDVEASTPPTLDKTASVPALVKAVDKWRATGQLLMRDRNTLRNFVHAAVSARLVLEDGCGGESSWTNSGKELAPAFIATTSVEFDDEKLGNALLPVDRDDDDDVRALRALAWVNHAGSWAGVPNGDSLERLCVERVEQWATRVAERILPSRDGDEDAELTRIARTLLAMAKGLGVADAFKPDAQSRAKALFASPPARADQEGRPNLHRWQRKVIEAGVGREVLQIRLLRRGSFTQGDGKPLAVDAPRLLRALRESQAEVAWPQSTPDSVRSTEAAVNGWLSSLDEVHAEAIRRVPDVSDIGGEVADIASALGKLIDERIAAGGLPAVIDPEALRAAARAVKPSDLKQVETIRGELHRWDELNVDDRVRLLVTDWERPVARVRDWLAPARTAIAALESNLQAGPASDAQRAYDAVRQDLIQDLEALADAVAGITGPEVIA